MQQPTGMERDPTDWTVVKRRGSQRKGKNFNPVKEHETGKSRTTDRSGDSRPIRCSGHPGARYYTGKGKKTVRYDAEKAENGNGKHRAKPTEPDNNNSNHRNVVVEPPKKPKYSRPNGTRNGNRGSNRPAGNSRPCNGQTLNWGLLIKTLEQAGMDDELRDRLSKLKQSKRPNPAGPTDRATKQLANLIFRYVQLQRHLANWKKLPTGLERKVDDYVKNLHPPCRNDALTKAYMSVTNTYKADIAEITTKHLIAERDKASNELRGWRTGLTEAAINMAAARLKKTYAKKLDRASLDDYLTEVYLFLDSKGSETVSCEDIEPELPAQLPSTTDTPPRATERTHEQQEAQPNERTDEVISQPAAGTDRDKRAHAKPMTPTARPLFSVIAARNTIHEPQITVVTAEIHEPPRAGAAEQITAEDTGVEPPPAAATADNHTPPRAVEAEPPPTADDELNIVTATVDTPTGPTAVETVQQQPQPTGTGSAGPRPSRKRPASPEELSGQNRPTKRIETTKRVLPKCAPNETSVIYPPSSVRDTMTISNYRQFQRILVIGGLATKFWKDRTLPAEWKVLSYPTLSLTELADLIIRSERVIPKQVEKIVLVTQWEIADPVTGFVATGEKLKRCKEIYGDRLVVLDPAKHPTDPTMAASHTEFIGTLKEAVGSKNVVGAGRYEVIICDNEPHIHTMTKGQVRCLLDFLYKRQ